MGFFRSHVGWSSDKQRKVLSKRAKRDTTMAADITVNSNGRVASVSDARNGVIPGHDSVSPMSLPEATVPPSRQASEFSHGWDPPPRYSLADAGPSEPPTIAKAGQTRLRNGPLFPDAPSNYSAVSSTTTKQEETIYSLSCLIWRRIANFLDPLDAANLAHASKTLRYRLGAEPWAALDRIGTHKQRVEFLMPMDPMLPQHLFCFLCATFHARVKPGEERLQPSHVLNPVFICPNARKLVLPRARLTHGRELPFAYVQLATRAHCHTPAYGIPLTSLARRWQCKDSEWSHSTRFHIHGNGHLLMRVSSTSYVQPLLQPNEQRLLLYSRSDYAPYFSVCAHWSDGNLMQLCKCALSHVPAPKEGVMDQLRKGPKLQFQKMHTNIMPKQCDNCKPLRRCGQCPTEYMIQLKLVEDKRDRLSPFKQAICVTRWSDLGDGTSPTTPEWASCNGQADFDSLGAVKNATICSIFEAAASSGAPGQQVKWLDIHRDTHQDIY